MPLRLDVGWKNDFFEVLYYRVDIWQPPKEIIEKILNSDEKLLTYTMWVDSINSCTGSLHIKSVTDAVEQCSPFVSWRFE